MINMERSDSRLFHILSQFWKWAGYDALNFSADGFTCADEKEPFYFPGLSQMRKLCYECENGMVSQKEAEDYLTCMALDNEEEHILDHCAEHATDEFILSIAQASLNHPQWHARWQIAELLGRRKIPQQEILLYSLSQDSHPYVRRRAKNAQEAQNASVPV